MKAEAIPVQQLNSFELEVSELIYELMETFASDDVQPEQERTRQALSRYKKRVARVGLIAGKYGLIGLHDICVEFRQIIHDLEKRSLELSDVEFELLEEWPITVMYYINSSNDTESAEKLLDFIQRPEWKSRIAERDIDDIRCLLGLGKADESREQEIDDQNALPKPELDETPIESTGTSESMDEAPKPDAETLTSLKEEVFEAMKECVAELKLTDSKDAVEANSSTLADCAARMELLGMSVAMSGLIGLMDACFLFQSCLEDLAEHREGLSPVYLDALKKWAPIFSAYLDDAENTKVAETLVNYLRTLPWTDSLSAEEAQNLKEILTPEEMQTSGAPNSAGLPLNEEDIGEPDVFVATVGVEESISLPTSEDTGSAETQLLELPRAYLELLELLSLELETSRDTLDSALATASAIDAEPGDRSAALKLYGDQLERLAAAAETLGLDGLCEVIAHIIFNLKQLAELDRPLVSDESNLFSGWLEIGRIYLNDPIAHPGRLALAGYLSSSQWISRLSQAQVSDLVDKLGSPEVVLDEEELEARQTVASQEDVSIELPQDVNQQLLDSLLQELPQYTAEFTESIARIAQGSGDTTDVEKAQRIAHTLKGSANTVGVTGLATLTHHIEDILQAFSKNKSLPGKKLADVLLNAADVLEMMSEHLLGAGSVPEQSQGVLQEILDWANQIDTQGLPEDDTPSNHSVPEISTVSGHVESSESSQSAEQNAPAEVTPSLRVPASLVDDLLRLVGESFILGGQISQRLRNVENESIALRKQNAMLQNLTHELEQIVDVQGVTASRRRDAVFEEFDALELDQYNELHTVTRQLVEAATDAREMTRGVEDHISTFETLLVEQARLHKGTQEVVIQTRMVPVQNIVPRLHRSVRQTCRLTKKMAEVVISGEETLIDSDVLNDLTEPLMHVLRNAVDHGIEQTDIREKLGKNEIGVIKLDFFRSGDSIVVRCQDDGGGLNYELIRNRAIEMGIITEEHLVTDDELARFILLPGFSTRNEVTQTSGRGMGMDVVQTKIHQMKGSIRVRSVRDQSSTIELRLPITLISIHGLLIEINSQTIALSSRGVERIIHGEDGSFHSEGEQLIYTLGEEQYDACELETLFGQAVGSSTDSSRDRAVLFVKNDAGKTTAVRVGKASASVDLVVKQLGPYVPDIPGLEGATILGDGGIAPVLDLVDLLGAGTVNTILPESAVETRIDNDSLPHALVVDDSLSARRSLAEFVEDVGFTVSTARDGMDAIEVMEEKTPDILLVDLEMPRMNGLELASHLRSKEEFKHIPIIMVTSRSTEKHRRQARSAGVNVYLTKPFSEDELLGCIQSELAQPEKIEQEI